MNIFNKKELDFNLILSISTILFLPSFIFVAFNASSLAAGILIASITIILINYKSIIRLQINLLAISLSIMFSIGVFISIAYFYVVESISKPLYSIVLVIVFLSAFILAQKISEMSYRILSNSILVLILFFLLLGWIQVFYIPQCCNYSSQLKPIFPFSEESHYALALGTLVVGYAFVGKLVWVACIGICLLFLALLFPNMTLLVFSLLIFFASLFRLRPIYFKTLLIFTPILISLFWILVISDLEYFSSRLNFKATNNLTTLVFLQGWDLAYINFIETSGIGLGFQMLGSSFTHLSEYTDLILAISGKENNLSDGGFLAAKVIAEFGAIGVIVLTFYIYFILKLIFYGNQIWYKIHVSQDFEYIQEIKKKLLLSGMLFGFLVEVFLRGYGYFSPGVYLFISIFFALYSSKNKFRKVTLK